MIQEIRALQLALGMSDAQLLQLAREVAGTVSAWDCGQVRCLEELIACEQAELIEELLCMPRPRARIPQALRSIPA